MKVRDRIGGTSRHVPEYEISLQRNARTANPTNPDSDSNRKHMKMVPRPVEFSWSFEFLWELLSFILGGYDEDADVVRVIDQHSLKR